MKLTITQDNLLSQSIATGAGEIKRPRVIKKTFQARGKTTAGAGAATIIIEASDFDNPGTGDWVTLGTITLTLSATNSSDGFTSDGPWKYVRARISAISGTNAAIDAVVAG